MDVCVMVGAQRNGRATAAPAGICRWFHNGNVRQYTMVGATQRSELRRGEESQADGAAATEERYRDFDVRVNVELNDVKYAACAGVFTTGHVQHGKRSALRGSGNVRTDYRFK